MYVFVSYTHSHMCLPILVAVLRYYCSVLALPLFYGLVIVCHHCEIQNYQVEHIQLIICLPGWLHKENPVQRIYRSGLIRGFQIRPATVSPRQAVRSP